MAKLPGPVISGWKTRFFDTVPAGGTLHPDLAWHIWAEERQATGLEWTAWPLQNRAGVAGSPALGAAAWQQVQTGPGVPPPTQTQAGRTEVQRKKQRPARPAADKTQACTHPVESEDANSVRDRTHPLHARSAGCPD